MHSFEYLVQELTDNFSVYDMEGEAKDRLGNLRMKELDTVRKYMIHFNTIAASTNWDSVALAWAFKHGLVIWVKDELSCLLNEPLMLSELRWEAQQLDNRYWRREEE